MDSTADSKLSHSGDAFAIGVLVMLLINVLQRSVGFVRGVGFAAFLSDVDLGNWALANSFLIIAVPILAFGVPGSFGKFVEHFRTRGQLRHYYSFSLWVTVAGAALGSAAMLLAPHQFSHWVFGDRLPLEIVLWCVLCLLSSIALSFVTELATGFRQVQIVSYAQFTQSLVFTLVGMTLVVLYESWWVLLPSFAISNVVASVLGWLRVRYHHAVDLSQKSEGASMAVWRRILPFAASLWIMRLMSNMFEVGDRYMLLHLMNSVGGSMSGGMTEGVGSYLGQAMVGQYHCARIFPNLLISVGVMLGGVLLPYLSADWEAGDKEKVSARVRQLLQAISIGFLALSVAVMSFAPFLFHYVIGDRYGLALQVLPLALAQAIWAAMFMVAEPYMLCAEKGKQLVGLLGVALLFNLGLNWTLIPAWGLSGAIVATAVANVLALALLLWRMSATGCRLGWGTLALCGLPGFLFGGPVLATLSLVAVVFIAGRTQWLLSAEDREQIDELIVEKLQRFGLRLESVWP